MEGLGVMGLERVGLRIVEKVVEMGSRRE